jgi:hypothetical protein
VEQLCESQRRVTSCHARDLLLNAVVVPHQEEERDPDQMYEVCLSLKGFSKFLYSHVVSTTTIACASGTAMVNWAESFIL